MHSIGKIERVLLACFFLAYGAAMFVYLFHALKTNPQYDNHVIWYAKDLWASLVNGKLSDFLLQSHKYPFLYILQFTFVQRVMAGVGDLAGIMFTDPAVFLVSRVTSLLYAIGTLWMTSRLSMKLTGSRWAVILLLCSLVFFMFATAIRPHIAVAFWTLVSFLFSIRLREQGGIKNAIFAWGAAVIAFGTLQSGIFAFIFPFFAYVSWGQGWKKWLQTGVILTFCIAVATIAGYPFLLGKFFGVSQEISMDLGHNVGFTYEVARGFRTIGMMLGSDIILLVFACAGFILTLRQRKHMHSMMPVMYVYIVLFTAAFLFHNSSTTRFFLPLFPLLAIIGIPAVQRLPSAARSVLWVFMIAVFIKFSLLASTPNTYQQLSSFVAKKEGKVAIHVSIPTYFTTIPTERFPLEKDDTDYSMAVATDIGFVSDKDLSFLSISWQRCGHFIASPVTDAIVLLWNDDTPWALYQVFRSRALGPNISVYCVR